MTEKEERLLCSLGFRFGTNGPHAARTMMLEDLRTLLAHVSGEASQAEYAEAIVSLNVLGKPTKKSRELSLRHLAALYGLDASIPLFRAMRRLWDSDVAAQPLLAVAIALARDPLLRATQEFILQKPLGVLLPREEVEDFLSRPNPGRFSAASLKSFAQNIAGTWTAAGFLSGRAKKTRSTPLVRPENVALCLFLGYLQGRTGQRLFSSEWMNLLGGSSGELEAMANSASHRGLIVFMNAGGVKEIRFPGYLTPSEEQLHQEISSVI